MKDTLETGVVHDIPNDLRNALLSSSEITEAWNDLTPLARNEWICWVTSVKKAETREDHIRRVREDMLKGKRRPCCWPGCIHREKNGK
ncbi:YdeI/OmpD-associated family protein [Candidatus Roizmanbacteria bacterium]|nr:MAG: YdeI/OmpD-associated family protein [Candidatus Roizmanbacteria bacterium]